MIFQKQFLPRGKGLGGSSQLNYMLHFSGLESDITRWKSHGLNFSIGNSTIQDDGVELEPPSYCTTESNRCATGQGQEVNSLLNDVRQLGSNTTWDITALLSFFIVNFVGIHYHVSKPNTLRLLKVINGLCGCSQWIERRWSPSEAASGSIQHTSRASSQRIWRLFETSLSSKEFENIDQHASAPGIARRSFITSLNFPYVHFIYRFISMIAKSNRLRCLPMMN